MTGQHALCSARKGFGYGVDGAFTEYVLARPESAHFMPSRLSFDECAATEPLCVAIHAVTDRVRLKPGDTIAIFGMGPVGLLALQAAKLYAPSKIIAIDLTENIRLKMAGDLGATHTVAGDKEEVTSKNLRLRWPRGRRCLYRGSRFDRDAKGRSQSDKKIRADTSNRTASKTGRNSRGEK